MIPNKLGIHVDANAEYGDTWNNLSGGYMKAVTLLINTQEPDKAAGSINAIENQVIRVFAGERNMDHTDQAPRTPAENAKMYGEMIAPLFGTHPNAFWMYWRNEIGDDSPDLEYHVQEMVEWIRWCKAHNIKAAFGGWSMGMPGLDKWDKIKPALVEANKSGALLVLHEYGVKEMIAGLDGTHPGEGFWCLRYRKVWRENKFSQLYPNLRLFISETGLDIDTKTNQGGPWKAISVPVEKYLAGLAWYASEIGKDPYVIGATVYALTTEDQWAQYDIQGPMLDALINFIKTKPNLDGTVNPTPNPVPVPIPDPSPPTPPVPQTLPVPGFMGVGGEYVKIAFNMNLPKGWNASYHNFGNIDMAPEYDPFYGIPPIARLWAAWSKLDACLYQTVSVAPGALVELSTDALGWSSNSGLAHEKGDNPMQVMIGLDPAGGTDYKASSVMWAMLPETILENELPLYIRTRVGPGGKITAFLRGKSTIPAVRNDVFFSNVKMVTIGEVQTPPSPPVDNGLSGVLYKVNTAGLNMRCGPSTGFAVRRVLPMGEVVRVMGPGDNAQIRQAMASGTSWGIVLTEKGEVGCVAGWYLKAV